MSGRLIHTGQVVLDLVMRVPGLPVSGGDLMASSTALLPGGGFNVMAAAARAGADVLYAGLHGGGFGELARAAMAVEGITLAHAPSAEGDTGIVVALLEDDGERTFITGTDAGGRMPPGLLDAVTPANRDVVYLTGYSLLDGSNAKVFLEWLPRTAGATVLFDPGPLVGEIPTDRLTAVLAYVDIVSCSTREAKILETADVEVLIVREGPTGCRVVHGGHSVTVPGFPVAAVDTNGAGDAHCGVLAAELLAGTGLLEAVRRANGAAAIAVTRQGPATSPTRAELDAFLG
ncbi:PfkB family carbohydrate kinase [Amycolatopsis azurea]|uniref:PfkB family carbohydrate kinase n=1 Tax=Amycolatopsis azurea TaxID=36819 RepID=UPI00380B6C07